MTWKMFDGHYDKILYDIRLDSGEIIENCWPNAGIFSCVDTGVEYDGSRVLMIKVRTTDF